MVTKMERKSIHEAKGGESKSSPEAEIMKAQGASIREAKAKVDAAIKARTESFGLLRSAAAHALYLMIDFGHTETFNRLFNGLPTIDADALRQKYVAKVIDAFGVGGERDPADESKWIKRPVSFITFTQKVDNGQHFKLAKVNEGDKESGRREAIQAARQAIREAGIEALESIDWLSRDAVIRQAAVYDETTLHTELSKVLMRAGKFVNDNDSHISRGQLISIGRAAGMPKTLLAKVEASFPAESTPVPSREEAATNAGTGSNQEAERAAEAA